MASLVTVVKLAVGVLLIEGMVSIEVCADCCSKETDPELRTLDWWEHTVIYQIYPRSFKDSDGDGIGDLKGITSELELFVDAGVGAIWLSPIFQSPMVDFGYDIDNFYEIHYEYGTMEDFEDLIRRAHELGIKVLLDFVPNHTSTESEYFKLSEQRDPQYENYFVWADPLPDPKNDSNRLVPSNWISLFGGSIWEWSDIRQQYYLHQFTAQQPDFNYREPAVRQEMLNILKFWIDKGADGFRCDALPYLFEANPDDYCGVYPDEPLSGSMFLTPYQRGYTTDIYAKEQIEGFDVVYEWREAIDTWQRECEGDTKILLVEAYSNISRTMLYYGNDQGRVGAHFPFNFDFLGGLTHSSNARDFVYIILKWMTYMPNGNVANWVFGNHDNIRMATRFRPNMVDGLNCLSMLLPGVAITYQGEEIGMRNGYVSWEDTVDVSALRQGNRDNYMDYSRDPQRTPYHWNNCTSAGFSTNPNTWLPIAEDYMEINLQQQKEAERSHFKVYQSMTSLRQEPALSHGNYHIQALSDNTLVLVRYLVTYQTYSLIFNVGEVEDTVDLARVSWLEEPIWVYTSSVHSTRETDEYIALEEITLQPGEALVLVSKPIT